MKAVAEVFSTGPSTGGGARAVLGWPHAAASIFAVVFCAYLAVNWQFRGPTYLTDEIGYLANAAFLTGSTIDAASSYHAGYSLFLVPALALGLDDRALWIAVVITNSILFGAAFALLYRLSRLFHADPRVRTIAVLLCAAYPSYLTINGYAYSQPAFVLVFVAACVVLAECSWTPMARTALFSFLTGFLYWIHPTGLFPVLAGIVVLGLTSWRDRRLALCSALGIGISIAMIASYKMMLEPALLAAMTPEGFEPRTHYPSLGETFTILATIGKWPDLIGRMAGYFTYLTVSTLSVSTIGIIAAVNASAAAAAAPESKVKELCLFIMFSLLGLGAVTALSFSGNSGIEKWLYGRYLEGGSLPILMIGLVSLVSPVVAAATGAAICLLFMGLFLGFGQWPGLINEISVAAFWPFALDQYVISMWSIVIGGLVAIAAAFLKPRLRLTALLVVFAISTIAQMQWHIGSFRISSYPSGLHRLITTVAPEKRCIGFDYDSIEGRSFVARERFNQLSYYFRDHDYRRMRVADYILGCDGFYLTYGSPAKMMKLGMFPIAQEMQTGLIAYGKEPLPADFNWEGGLLYSARVTPSGSVTFTGTIRAATIAEHTKVGKLKGDLIVTTATGGFLTFGPYIRVDPGLLRITAIGTASNMSGASFEIFSRGKKIGYESQTLESTGSHAKELFETGFPISQLYEEVEFRLKVEEDTEIGLEAYIISVTPDLDRGE